MTATVTAPSGPAQRKRGVVLEDAILAAAYAELTEVGYTQFTVESVAARARTGKASIYRRWTTKQALVLDALCAGLPTPRLQERDIETDPEWHHAFFASIPVVELGDRRLELATSVAQLRRLLTDVLDA